MSEKPAEKPLPGEPQQPGESDQSYFNRQSTEALDKGEPAVFLGLAIDFARKNKSAWGANAKRVMKSSLDNWGKLARNMGESRLKKNRKEAEPKWDEGRMQLLVELGDALIALANESLSVTAALARLEALKVDYQARVDGTIQS